MRKPAIDLGAFGARWGKAGLAAAFRQYSRIGHQKLSNGGELGTTAIRNLAGTLETVLGSNGSGHVVLIGSAHPGEGKTTIATAFAKLLSQDPGKRILVVDAGQKHDLSGFLKDVPVLSLKSFPPVDQSKSFPTGLYLATIDLEVRDPILPFLASDAAVALRKAFDYVVIEVPASGNSSALAQNAKHADGVVLVIEADRTRWPIIDHLCQRIVSAEGRILGAVLNKRKFYIPKIVYSWL